MALLLQKIRDGAVRNEGGQQEPQSHTSSPLQHHLLAAKIRSHMTPVALLPSAQPASPSPALPPCLLQVLKRGKWMRVRAGKRILSDEESQVRVCLLVEGLAGLETTYYG